MVYENLDMVWKKLELAGMEDICYFSASGDLEFLAGSSGKMDSRLMHYLNTQGFEMFQIYLGCTHKVVFLFRANRLRFSFEKRGGRR